MEYDEKLQARVIAFKRQHGLGGGPEVTPALWEKLISVTSGENPPAPEKSGGADVAVEALSEFVGGLRAQYPELAALADLGLDENALQERFAEILRIDDELISAVEEIHLIAEKMAAGPKGV